MKRKKEKTVKCDCAGSSVTPLFTPLTELNYANKLPTKIFTKVSSGGQQRRKKITAQLTSVIAVNFKGASECTLLGS